MRYRAHFAAVVWMLVLFQHPLLFSHASGPDETAASFKFDRNEQVILVPVRIGAKEYQFVLDTGVCDSRVAATADARLAVTGLSRSSATLAWKMGSYVTSFDICWRVPGPQPFFHALISQRTLPDEFIAYWRRKNPPILRALTRL
jgi:hypothetical protein